MRRWSRRGVLALGLAGAGAALLRPEQVRAATVSVAGLSFEVPASFTEVTDARLGEGWQWQGSWTPDPEASFPAAVVLARADVDSTEVDEVLALLLAGAPAGRFPDLELGPRRDRAGAGSGDETRMELRYTPERGLSYHGTLLITTRTRGPAGVLAVLGDDTLTAGTQAQILDSVRWSS